MSLGKGAGMEAVGMVVADMAGDVNASREVEADTLGMVEYFHCSRRTAKMAACYMVPDCKWSSVCFCWP